MEELLNGQLAELEANLNKLKSAVEYIEHAKGNAEEISDAASKVVASLKDIQKEYITLRSANEKLLGKIDKIDFPTRLDKLDVTMATINQNISNLQSRLEKIFNELDSKLSDNKNIIISKISESYKELSNTLSRVQSTLNHHSKEIKFTKIYTIISSSIILIFLVIIVYKLFIG